MVLVWGAAGCEPEALFVNFQNSGFFHGRPFKAFLSIALLVLFGKNCYLLYGLLTEKFLSQRIDWDIFRDTLNLSE